MVQVENEYGAVSTCDAKAKNYTHFLRDLLWSKLGSNVQLYTSKLNNNLRNDITYTVSQKMDFCKFKKRIIEKNLTGPKKTFLCVFWVNNRELTGKWGV